MGFLGGNNEPSPSDQLLNEQITQNKAELAQKRQSLYKTRLDIIKGQGGQSWTPSPTPARKGGSKIIKAAGKVLGGLAGRS